MSIFENGFGNRNKNRLDDYGLGSPLLLLKMYSSLNVSFFDLFLKNDLVSLDIIVNVIDAFVCLINQGLIIKLLYWRDVEPKNIDTRQILDLQF